MTIYLLAGGRIAELIIPLWVIGLAAGFVIGWISKPFIKEVIKHF